MSSLAMSEKNLDAVRARNPDAFQQPIWKRLGAPITLGICVLYTVFCFWFFSIGKTVSEGNWDIAGAYLADWVSYEVRPDINYATGDIEIEWPRFSPLGENPDPDWIVTERGLVTLITPQEADSDASTSSDGAGSFMSPNSSATSIGSAGTAVPLGTDNAGEAEFSFMSPNSAASSTGSDAETNGGTSGTVQSKSTDIKEGVARAVIIIAPGSEIVTTASLVSVKHAGQTLEIEVDPFNELVTPRGKLPEWSEQKREGSKVLVNFGFAGRAEVRAKEVKVSKRYWGWENFVFDTRSPYWGMSFGQVTSHLLAGPKLIEGRSNWAVFWDNIVNNADWQHGDVWLKLLQTIVMAFVGTLFACIVAFPLSFVAARNITPNRFLNHLLKRSFDFLRSVDMLIWALFFTRAFGPGPLAGISAIFFTDTGTFGKLYAETLENIDDKQREGVRSVGAHPAQVQRYGVVPQVLPVFASQALYFWESNTRSATIIGAVGAGGIGLKLWEAMRTNQDWENVAYMVILILIVVFIFDGVSNAIRSRLIGKQG